MKLTYKKQMIIAVIIIILTNIMTEIFDFWIYRSIGFGIFLFLNMRLEYCAVFSVIKNIEILKEKRLSHEIGRRF